MTMVAGTSYTDNRNIDGGWAWVVFGVAYINLMIHSIVGYSTGIIAAAILDEVTDDYTWASTVGALHVSIMFLTGPAAGVLNSKIGCRLTGVIACFIMFTGLSAAYFASSIWSIAITFGVVAGIGYGMMYNVVIVASGYYFHRLRAFTSGIISSGIGIGIFIGPIIIRTLIDKYNLNGMFLVAGAISIQMLPLVLLIRPLPIEKRQQCNKYGSKESMMALLKSSLRSFYRNKSFLFYLVSIFSWSTGESVAVMHMPVYAVEQGSTKMQAATLFTAYGGGTITARILAGMLANNKDINKSLLQASFLGITGIITLVYPTFSGSFVGQMFYAGCVALFTGGIPALLNPLVVEHVGLQSLATAFGFTTMVSGITYLLVPTILGSIVENTGCMACVFYFAGCIMLMGCFMALISGVYLMRKKYTATNKENELMTTTNIETGTVYVTKEIELSNQESLPLKTDLQEGVNDVINE